MAEATGYTGIEILSNDKSALSPQRVSSWMTYLGRNECIAEPVAAVDRRFVATAGKHRWVELAMSAFGRKQPLIALPLSGRYTLESSLSRSVYSAAGTDPKQSVAVRSIRLYFTSQFLLSSRAASEGAGVSSKSSIITVAFFSFVSNRFMLSLSK